MPKTYLVTMSLIYEKRIQAESEDAAIKEAKETPTEEFEAEDCDYRAEETVEVPGNDPRLQEIKEWYRGRYPEVAAWLTDQWAVNARIEEILDQRRRSVPEEETTRDVGLGEGSCPA